MSDETLRLGAEEFTCGSRRFRDHPSPTDPGNAKIYLPILIEELGLEILGLVDTGSDWSVLDWQVAAELDLLRGQGQRITILTRLGRFEGALERVALFLAADRGQSLKVDATFFVSPDWRAGTFLGYNGLLQHIRFAIDAGENRFHFGVASFLSQP